MEYQKIVPTAPAKAGNGGKREQRREICSYNDYDYAGLFYRGSDICFHQP